MCRSDKADNNLNFPADGGTSTLPQTASFAMAPNATKKERSSTVQIKKLSPVRWLATWKGNLLFFGFMIVIALAHSFWQVQHAKKIFFDHTREHAGAIAKLINLDARNAVVSRNILEEMVEINLRNIGGFIDYLSTVKSVSELELTFLAEQAGLTGIRIVSGNGDATEGPPRWLVKMESTGNVWKPSDSSLQYIEAQQQYLINLPRMHTPGNITLGISSTRIEKLQKQIDLSHLLNDLSTMAGICYARHERSPGGADAFPAKTDFIITDTSGNKVAETHFPLDGGTLVIGLDADCFLDKARQIWIEFVVFGTIIALLGFLFSWLLYRYQCSALSQVRKYERKLAAEREDAALGRASAVIAHEIRNPLNAVSIGLQRLKAEASALGQEHLTLVSTIQNALGRTNGIVSNLQRYAASLITLRDQKVQLGAIVTNVLMLYQEQILRHSIRVETIIEFDKPICGDADLLEEVIENLLKNAIEAQPQGGDIIIRISETREDTVFLMENNGFLLAAKDINKILAPYFTTKTTGTGLGLSIARRIVISHGGTFHVETPEEHRLRVIFSLPKTIPGHGTQYRQEDHANPNC